VKIFAKNNRVGLVYQYIIFWIFWRNPVLFKRRKGEAVWLASLMLYWFSKTSILPHQTACYSFLFRFAS
jgi:hypothetical protein